jgi:uncharacterized protein YutE (UPF0331/DUF86 family)/predicted nucleotidyltransferase
LCGHETDRNTTLERDRYNPVVDRRRTSLIDALSAEPGVRLAVLFGSSARGRERRGSDLDVGVVGEPEDGENMLQVRLARATGRSVDLVALDTAPPLLRFEIARDGQLLLERTPHLWSDFKAKAMVDWWDWAPIARRFQAAAAARLRRQAHGGSRDVAGVRIAGAMTWLDDAARVFEQSADAFVAATKDRDLAIFYLFLGIQESIDLAAHWVADAAWDVPDEAGATFDVLADREAIDRDLATTLRAAVGLRNRIAHGDAMLDYGRVRSEALAGIPALRRFLAAVAKEAGL